MQLDARMRLSIEADSRLSGWSAVWVIAAAIMMNTYTIKTTIAGPSPSYGVKVLDIHVGLVAYMS